MIRFATKKRKEIGSNKVSKLRAEGFIPGVAYGRTSETAEIAIPKIEFEKFLAYNQVGSRVEIKVGRSYQDAVIKSVQRDPVTREVLHADFQLLTKGEKIKLKIPVHVKGKENVEDKRTIVQDSIHELEIVALPKDLIDNITLDVTGKVIGDNITIEDIIKILPEGIEINEDLDKIIVSVVGQTEVVEEEDETTEESEEIVTEELEVL